MIPVLIQSGLPNSGTIEATGKTVTDVGHIFGASADGLVLYALILGTFMLFVALMVQTVIFSRERSRASKDCAAQAAAFVDGAKLQAEALKELATAFASGNSADQALKQAMFALYPELVRRVDEIERMRAGI